MSEAYIHKGGFRGVWNLQKILNFLQKDRMRKQKVSRFHYLQSFWLSFLLITYVRSLLNLPIKILKQNIYSQQILAILWFTQYFATFCHENLRTFSADLFGLKNRFPQTLSFFGCMVWGSTRWCLWPLSWRQVASRLRQSPSMQGVFTLKRDNQHFF